MKPDINNWIQKIINGSSGFHVCEEHEIMIHHISREHSIAAWVIRCLANPDCEGSEDVLKAINKQRTK